MGMRRVGFVHTSTLVAPLFSEQARATLGGVDFFHIADDSLIRDVIANGGVTPAVARRVLAHILLAQDAGADIVVLTCSSVGEVAEWAVRFARVPVLRVDLPMAERAVQMGERIGVVATLSTTLKPTVDLIKRRAIAAGRQVTVNVALCDGAFDCLMNGDSHKHDELVRQAILELSRTSEVVVLAQASMTRVLNTIDSGELRAPVLSSPPLAMEYLKRIS